MSTHYERSRMWQQRETEGSARLEWLRTAVEAGFLDIDNGDYVSLRSREEIDLFIDSLRREVLEKRIGGA